MPFLNVIPLTETSLQQQVQFSGNISENKCCSCKMIYCKKKQKLQSMQNLRE